MAASSSTSSSKARKVILALVFAAAAVLFIIDTGVIYESAQRENKINAFSKSRFDDFYALESGTLDIAFVGSSHSYCSFDPEIFDNTLGTLSHQLGMPLQHPDGTYFTLLEMYNYQSQSPGIVVMELYWDMLDDGYEPSQVESLFTALNNPELKNRFVAELSPVSEAVKQALPFINHQQAYFLNRSDEIKKAAERAFSVTESKPAQKGREYYRSKGYVYCDMLMLPDELGRTNQYNGFDGKNFEISAYAMKYLDKIVELCAERGSTLIFVTAPVANASLERIANYGLVHRAVAAYAEKRGIDYYDYNLIGQDEAMFTNDNFRDDAHLNHSGVMILDGHFAEVLREALTRQ